VNNMTYAHKNISRGIEKTEEIIPNPRDLAICIINMIQGKTEGKWMSYHDFLTVVTKIANKEMTNCVIADSVLYGTEMLYKDGDFEIWRALRVYNMLCDETSFWFRVTYQAIAVGKKIKAIYIERVLD
jgi:hypothetical protein